MGYIDNEIVSDFTKKFNKNWSNSEIKSSRYLKIEALKLVYKNNKVATELSKSYSVVNIDKNNNFAIFQSIIDYAVSTINPSTNKK